FPIPGRRTKLAIEAVFGLIRCGAASKGGCRCVQYIAANITIKPKKVNPTASMQLRVHSVIFCDCFKRIETSDPIIFDKLLLAF
ncbi:MAG: hypothetical protein J7K65_06550, partial [Planctomycetes bacterium]|nr:hypothetical protein [Planctomycetota bacterium]